MNNNSFNINEINKIVLALKDKKIIAYPTESVFGLGCDPDYEIVVKKILILKNRPIEKGLILVASNYEQIKKYIDETKITIDIKKRLFSSWPGPISWALPANSNVPVWLTGKYDKLVVRISNFLPIRLICQKFGKAIISTSANVSQQLPARTVDEVYKLFGSKVVIMNDIVGKLPCPTKICDAISNTIIRG
ncbi:MAG: Sua5/YciO/YrdC/YwlC family protein [Candidatus Lightella neohaematopini]|nr:Sua5/YciO/YrdC/YwlC family protein [Candidatus Lightella neohaematopini]MCV2531411.1 Sua5/YciO/YrdC/YwlC family protein [Candidatus Lightella neohaematopini]